MAVSGNPALPSKAPPTLKFFSDFEKKYFENGEKTVKTIYFHHFLKGKKKQQKKHTDQPYLIFFRPLPETNIIFF